jgi:hypothetical protein
MAGEKRVRKWIRRKWTSGYENWLENGWNLWKVAWLILGGIVTVVAVITFLPHIHEKRAWLYLLPIVAYVLVWAIADRFRWKIRHDRLINVNGGRGAPVLEITTGNGEPWDDPRHGPKPKYKMVGPLDEIVKATSAFTPKPVLDPNGPKPPPPPPAPEHSKKFLVTNNGDGKAIGCRGVLTGPLSHNVDLQWDHPDKSVRDLVPGESDYLVLPMKHFRAPGPVTVEITIFADAPTSPTVSTFTLDVQESDFPVLTGSVV